MSCLTTQFRSLTFQASPFRSFAGLLSFACWSIVGVAGSVMADEPKPVSFARDIKPVLKRLCLGCHGPAKQEGKLRLAPLRPDLVKGTDALALTSLRPAHHFS